MHYLDGAWAGILVLGLVLTGLAAFAGTLALLERRGPFRPSQWVVGLPPRLGRRREWELVMRRATKELARGPRVEALQADAKVKIEAAEYAYNRMLADYAEHCAVPAPASGPILDTTEPVLEPAREPADAPAEDRAPLAA